MLNYTYDFRYLVLGLLDPPSAPAAFFLRPITRTNQTGLNVPGLHSRRQLVQFIEQSVGSPTDLDPALIRGACRSIFFSEGPPVSSPLPLTLH